MLTVIIMYSIIVISLVSYEHLNYQSTKIVTML